MTLHAKMVIPDLHCTFDQKRKILSCLWYCRVYECLRCEFLHCFLKSMEVNLRKETTNKNLQFKETKSLIYNSYLIRQSFQGYRCKSGIYIFAWRVTWNYASNPLKYIFRSCQISYLRANIVSQSKYSHNLTKAHL